MFIATLIVSLLLALALLSSASGKLTKKPAVIEQITAVGVPADKIPLLGYLEIAGALGLIAGLFWWPIGVAAAIGVILYFLARSSPTYASRMLRAVHRRPPSRSSPSQPLCSGSSASERHATRKPGRRWPRVNT